MRLDERSCNSKIAYDSRVSASAALEDFRARGMNSKRIYFCPTCGMFHLSSKLENPGRAKKIDKVIRNLRGVR